MKNTGQQYARDSSRSTSGIRAFMRLLCLCAVLTASGYAQQISAPNFDDIGPPADPPPATRSPGWNLCLGGPLPGDPTHSCAGANAPTSTSQAFSQVTPSLDGESMLLSETGADSNIGSNPPTGSNTGWFYNTGVTTPETYFTLDLEFNIADNSKIQSVEFDQFQYLQAPHGGVSQNQGQNTRVFFGTQCVKGQDWQVWDQLSGHWRGTGMPCSYVVSPTAFNHLTIVAHRVPGDTSCSGPLLSPLTGTFTGPRLYYDSITLNGTVVVSNPNVSTCSGPTTFTEQTGLHIQLDSSSACGSTCTISEYIDKGTFVASNMGPWWPAIQQLLLDN